VSGIEQAAEPQRGLSVVDVDRQASAVLGALRDQFKVSVSVLAEQAGYTEDAIRDRLDGAPALTAGEVQLFARIFKVPMELFYGEPEDAQAFVILNRVRLDFEPNRYRRGPRKLRSIDGEGTPSGSTIWETAPRGLRRRAHLTLVDPVPA